MTEREGNQGINKAGKEKWKKGGKEENRRTTNTEKTGNKDVKKVRKEWK